MAKQKEIKHIAELIKRGPKTRPIATYSRLVDYLQEKKISPMEALRIINDHKQKSEEGNIRFNWKMIRFTMFVWERLEEDKKGYLKPKIDTVRNVVKQPRFKDLYYGYYPDIKFNYEEEERKLNKLIAEKPQQKFFKEGYYYYPGSTRFVPQKHLDHILSAKK